MRLHFPCILVIALVGCGRAQLRVPHTHDAAADSIVITDAVAVPDVDRPPPVINALLVPICGPTDGPAIELLVSESTVGACPTIPSVPPPYDDLNVNIDIPTAPTTITIDESLGWTQHCAPDGNPGLACNAAPTTTLVFESISPSVVTGSYTMFFEDGTTRHVTFVATVCPPMRMCG